MILKHKIVFPDYPIEVETTKGRKAKYWYIEDEEQVPLKYLKNLGYLYDWYENKKGETVLCEINTQEPIIRNANVVDKPRTKKINGQLLHELKLKDYERSLIIKTLKTYFFSVLKTYKKIEIQKFPIHIKLTFHINRKLIEDIDNHALFYQKTLFDCLVETKTIRKHIKMKVVFEKVNNKYGFLIDDNVDVIKGFGINWKNSDNRKIVCEIYETE